MCRARQAGRPPCCRLDRRYGEAGACTELGHVIHDFVFARYRALNFSRVDMPPKSAIRAGRLPGPASNGVRTALLEAEVERGDDG